MSFNFEPSDCRCTFELLSATLDAFSVPLSEIYMMPCRDATKFLKTLDPTYNASVLPMHKVKKYEIHSTEHTYTSKLTETPAKAAAKISLFMENPDLMPKGK
ncbi:MAG: hypothetical protein H0X29_07255 [Parachlamydiaceae bacterium]|nr:hypothetical protein [Parachlamydiaceae bacterium]